MNEASSASAARNDLTADVAAALDHRGFVVLPGMLSEEQMRALADAYDAAAAASCPDDVHVGTTTTRVTDFVNRGAEFDGIYVFPELISACRHVIDGPFKLSSFHARTLGPRKPAQDLHVDVARESADWPLVGFIVMIDAFRPENGATRFVPGSHRWEDTPERTMVERRADYPGQVLACGAAGSLVIFNGSTWHGHTSNTSDQPRRSLQGAFIPRAGRAGTDFAARMPPATRARLSSLAHDVLGL